MIPWIGTVVAALLTLGALCSPSIAWAAWAKPADLPANVQQQCPEGRDGQQAEGFRARPSDLAPQIFTPAPTSNDLQARRLFEIAERCRAAGDDDKARTCYEEVHLLSPGSPEGRLAIDRLWELDRARLRTHADADTAEEQDAPPLRRLHREPTERRRHVAEPALRRRESIRPVDGDARHKAMLRSTEPLETLPERSQDEDDALQAIQYYEVPPVALTGPQSEKPRRMPMADEETASEPTAGAPSSWTPGFDFMSGAIQIQQISVEDMTFPWDGWRVRLIQGLLRYEWPQPCVVQQHFRPEARIRRFGDWDGSVNGFVLHYVGFETTLEFAANSIGFLRATVSSGALVEPCSHSFEYFPKNIAVTSKAIATSIGPTPSAAYLPPMSLFSKQPTLFLVYPTDDPMSFDEVKPAALPGTQGDFDVIPRPIF